MKPAPLLQPKFLRRTDGQWHLDVDELVALGPNLLRPVPRSIAGPDAIRHLLINSGFPAAILEATEHMIKQADCTAAGNLCFKASGMTWVEVPYGTVDGEPSENQFAKSVAQMQERVQQQLRALAMHLSRGEQGGPVLAPFQLEEVERRLAAVEGKLQESLRLAARRPEPPALETGAQVSPPPADRADTPLRVAADASTALRAISDAETMDGPVEAYSPIPSPKADAAATFLEVASNSAPVHMPSSLTVAPDDQTLTTRAIVKLPDAPEVEEILQMLVDESLVVKSRGDASIKELFGNAKQRPYVCILQDDNGHDAGAVLADLKAVAFLGGTMIMLPEGAIAEMAKSRNIQDDVLDAFSEIVNTLVSIINRPAENRHVRATKTRPFDASAHPWVDTPSLTVHLTEERFAANICLVAI